MRLFIAINFPANVKDEISALIDNLRISFPQIRWSKEENLHLTVKFLGNIKSKDENLAGKIKDSLQEISQKTEILKIDFSEIGFFDREQLIVWLGIRAGQSLLKLAEKIDGKMAKLGFPLEKRSYFPHVTLGRGKHLSSRVKQEIKNNLIKKKYPLPKSFFCDEICLINSTLTIYGARYSQFARFLFAKESV